MDRLTFHRTSEGAPSTPRSGVLPSLRSSALATAVGLYGVLHGTAERAMAQEDRPSAAVPVDASAFKAMMRDATSRPDVLNMQERALEDHFRQLMLWMDEERFREREEANLFLIRDVRRLIAHMNPLPTGVREIIGSGSPEQLYRTSAMREELGQINEEREARLGFDGTLPASELLARWKERLGFGLSVDERLISTVHAPVRIEREDTYAMNIARICRAIGAVPSVDGSLQPAPGDAMVTAAPKAVGIIRTAGDGTKTMKVLYEPGRGVIARSQPHPSGHGDWWSAGTPTIVLAPQERPPFAIDVTIGYASVTADIPIGELKHIGFQLIAVSGGAWNGRHRTTVDISRNDCHAHTPPQDYARPIFESGRYALIDAGGRALRVFEQACTPHMVPYATSDDPPPAPEGIDPRPEPEYVPDPQGRTLVTMTTDARPYAARVTAWSKYRNETLRLPPFDLSQSDR